MARTYGYKVPVTKTDKSSPSSGKTNGDRQVVPDAQGLGPRKAPDSVKAERRYGKK